MQRCFFETTPSGSYSYYEVSLTIKDCIDIAVIGDKYSGKHDLIQKWFHTSSSCDVYQRYVQLNPSSSSVKVNLYKFSSKTAFEKCEVSFDIVYYVYDAESDRNGIHKTSYYNITNWMSLARKRMSKWGRETVIGLYRTNVQSMIRSSRMSLKKSQRINYETEPTASSKNLMYLPTINNVLHININISSNSHLHNIFMTTLGFVYDRMIMEKSDNSYSSPDDELSSNNSSVLWCCM